MLTIRFQRAGKSNRPEFRVVVAPKTAAAQKKFTEALGFYNPRTKELVIKDQARLDYWLAQRIQLSPSVQNLLISKKLLDAVKVKAFRLPKKEVPKQVESTTPATEQDTTAAASESAADSAEAVIAEQVTAS